MSLEDYHLKDSEVNLHTTLDKNYHFHNTNSVNQLVWEVFLIFLFWVFKVFMVEVLSLIYLLMFIPMQFLFVEAIRKGTSSQISQHIC